MILALLGVGACKQAEPSAVQRPASDSAAPPPQGVVSTRSGDSIRVGAAASVTAVRAEMHDAGAVEPRHVTASTSPLTSTANSVYAGASPLLNSSKADATREVAMPAASAVAVNQKTTKYCKLEKIAFDQAHACANDGTNEFCVADNAAAQTAVRAIFPGVRCMRGGGRANCLDAPGQLLCFVNSGRCTTDHGATDDAYWLTICDLSLLPQVNHITHTVYE
jgi:hypothetical protein